MSKDASSRSVYLDNCKFFLILLVVFQHFLAIHQEFQGIACYRVGSIIVAFHMPLFLFLSGLSANKRNEYKNRIVYLLMVYFTFNICIWLVNGGYPISVCNGASWFVLALAIYTLAQWLLDSWDYRVVLVLIVVLECVTLFDGLFNYPPDGYNYRIATWFFFYYLGTGVGVERFERIFSSLVLRVISVVCSIAVIILLFRGGAFNFNVLISLLINPNGEYASLNGILFKALAYICTMVLSAGFLALIPRKNLGLISSFGGRTIQVYFWHYLFRNILYNNNFFEKECRLLFSIDPTGGALVLFIVSVMVTMLFSTRFFCYPLVFLKRPKK